MSDLVEFLKARLDEDEQTAQAATSESGRWRWDHGFGELCNDPECPYGALLDEATRDGTHAGTVLMELHGYDVKEPWQGAAHIARHDPARVLREVDAKRRIVALHSDPHGGDPSCSSIDYPESAEDCETLRLLALPYADHPDYEERWRP